MREARNCGCCVARARPSERERRRAATTTGWNRARACLHQEHHTHTRGGGPPLGLLWIPRVLSAPSGDRVAAAAAAGLTTPLPHMKRASACQSALNTVRGRPFWRARRRSRAAWRQESVRRHVPNAFLSKLRRAIKHTVNTIEYFILECANALYQLSHITEQQLCVVCCVSGRPPFPLSRLERAQTAAHGARQRHSGC